MRGGRAGSMRWLTREGEGRGKRVAAGVEGARREKECDRGRGVKICYIYLNKTVFFQKKF